jgi:hypothetical protein
VYRPSPPPAQPAPRRAEPPPQPAAESRILIKHAPPAIREWKFSGKVFDLLTLQPVADADIVFADPGSVARFAISTNAEGVYRLVMPANSGGYDVRVSHPDYESRFVSDGTPPLRDLSAKQRRTLIANHAATLQHRELFAPDPQGRLKRDMALIPTDLPPE